MGFSRYEVLRNDQRIYPHHLVNHVLICFSFSAALNTCSTVTASITAQLPFPHLSGRLPGWHGLQPSSTPLWNDVLFTIGTPAMMVCRSKNGNDRGSELHAQRFRPANRDHTLSRRSTTKSNFSRRKDSIRRIFSRQPACSPKIVVHKNLIDLWVGSQEQRHERQRGR